MGISRKELSESKAPSIHPSLLVLLLCCREGWRPHVSTGRQVDELLLQRDAPLVPSRLGGVLS